MFSRRASEYEIQAIVGMRRNPRFNNRHEFQVKWVGYTQRTWQPVEDFLGSGEQMLERYLNRQGKSLMRDVRGRHVIVSRGASDRDDEAADERDAENTASSRRSSSNPRDTPRPGQPAGSCSSTGSGTNTERTQAARQALVNAAAGEREARLPRPLQRTSSSASNSRSSESRTTTSAAARAQTPAPALKGSKQGSDNMKKGQLTTSSSKATHQTGAQGMGSAGRTRRPAGINTASASAQAASVPKADNALTSYLDLRIDPLHPLRAMEYYNLDRIQPTRADRRFQEWLPNDQITGRSRNPEKHRKELDETLEVKDESGCVELVMFTKGATRADRLHRLELAKEYQATHQRFYLEDEDHVDFMWQRGDDGEDEPGTGPLAIKEKKTSTLEVR